MARVLGGSIRSCDQYEAIHPFESDHGIVRLIKIERPKVKVGAGSQDERAYKVLIDASLCRRVRAQFGFKEERIHATIHRLVNGLDREQMAILKSVPVGDLFKSRSRGARIIGDYLDPNRLYKAIDLCGAGLVRLEPYSFEDEVAPLYEVKIPFSLVRKIRTHLTEGVETLSQTTSKALIFLLNTKAQGIQK